MPQMRKSNSIYQIQFSVAYLGFQKGGAKFSLATSAHTKGDQTKFSNFFSMSKKNFFWPKGGHGTMASPLNTPLDTNILSNFLKEFLLIEESFNLAGKKVLGKNSISFNFKTYVIELSTCRWYTGTVISPME